MKLDESARLPATDIDEGTLRSWKGTVDVIKLICENLFDTTKKPIGKHIEILLDELMKLEEKNLHDAEIEIRDRILEVFFELSESESIEITSIEFGEIVNSLIQEKEEEEDSQKGKKISVTSPEGMDCSEKKIILFLGVDDRDIPRSYAEPWPRFVNEIGKHQETERYLFLSVIRAASQKLHLSFSRIKNEDVCRSSIYLDECCSLLDMKEPVRVQMVSKPQKA
jgi:exonuclease V gamma subunit